MQVLAVVGPSGAGKTALIERVLPRLAEGGRASTVKSIHHDVEVDEPGKDTYRHRRAGSTATVGVTPSRTFGFVERGKSSAGEEAATLGPLLSGFADNGVDYALVEGFGGSALPKVVVGRADGSEDGAAEPVVARVDDGGSVDPGAVVEAVHGLRGYETATSVAALERRRDPDGTVAVASVDAIGLLAAADWTRDRFPAPAESIRDDLGDRPGVDRVVVAARPPVEPAGSAAVHVAVTATDPEPAFAAVLEAGDRLAASTGTDAAVGYRLQRG